MRRDTSRRHGFKRQGWSIEAARLARMDLTEMFAHGSEQILDRVGSEAADRRTHEESIRWDRVNRVRAEIADGKYDSAEKLETAFDRLLADLESR